MTFFKVKIALCDSSAREVNDILLFNILLQTLQN